jgi:hypothetical protein
MSARQGKTYPSKRRPAQAPVKAFSIAPKQDYQGIARRQSPFSRKKIQSNLNEASAQVSFRTQSAVVPKQNFATAQQREKATRHEFLSPSNFLLLT